MRYYEVRPVDGDELRVALNRASPVREGGQIFHGRTDWSAQSDYRWWQEADGRCRVTESRVNLSIVMTLPRLAADAPDAMRARFDSYLARLREHEEGHVRIARETAFAIASRIRSLPEAKSCEALEAAAENARAALMDEARQRERRYDRDTGYGASQGARLD
ncbi:DUF922 domain-containing protein [Niveibacterium sp. SC-1]|uniref:DUF922 domain-containing protein n=1 Tax=Niveibacterium sp. SC-1 TaxID=3135646 RepID=UPI00311EB083